MGREKLKLKLNESKITSKENLSRDGERGGYGRAPRHGGTVLKL